MIDELILFDNELTLEHFGHGPIKDYYNIVVIIIIRAYMNNYCKMFLSFWRASYTKEISRITTIGFSDLEKKEEKLLFQLDNITETCYIINASEDDLKTNDDLVQHKDLANINRNENRETSFAVFETSQKQTSM